MSGQLDGEDGKQLRRKTSVSIDDDLWKKFCSIVVSKYGNRMNSDVLEELIKKYIEEENDGNNH